MKNQEIKIPVRNNMLGFTDRLVAFLGFEEKIKYARHKIRDERNKITWVNDRLQGLSVENCIFDEGK